VLAMTFYFDKQLSGMEEVMEYQEQKIQQQMP
jgi:hypothetical protein